LKTVAIYTLGCKLNFSESSEIGRVLESEGYQRVPFGTQADITIVHTCSVTGTAERKTRQTIHKAIRSSPEGIIVAMGCEAQLDPLEVASWKGVNLVLGTHEKFNLPALLRSYTKQEDPIIQVGHVMDNTIFHPAHSEGERTRSFLKIQDGCDYVCTYCTIPKARGRSRNPSIASLITQAETISKKGIREIVLTGVNVGDFGRSTKESFYNLLQQLDQVEQILRFRISSIEPNLLNNDLIRFIAESKRIAPHFHLPLQSGTDKILKLMKRRYATGLFRERVNRIKELLPDASVGADLIVGFPGETDDDFKQTREFVESLPLSYLHVFTYSERPGTPAAELPDQVPHEVRHERSRIMHDLASKIKNKFYLSQAGTDKTVIFEHILPDGHMTGWSENYVEVAVPFDETLLHHEAEVTITRQRQDQKMAGVLLNAKNR